MLRITQLGSKRFALSSCKSRNIRSAHFLPSPQLRKNDSLHSVYTYLVKDSTAKNLLESAIGSIDIESEANNSDHGLASVPSKLSNLQKSQEKLCEALSNEKFQILIESALQNKNISFLVNLVALAYRKNCLVLAQEQLLKEASELSSNPLLFLSTKLSRQVLILVRDQGKIENLSSLCGYLLPYVIVKDNTQLVCQKRAVSVLQLSTDDINQCIEYCIQKDLYADSFNWFSVLKDESITTGFTPKDKISLQSIPTSMYTAPNEKTYSLLLRSTSIESCWNKFFYVYSCFQHDTLTRGISISQSTYEFLIERCLLNPTNRWQYAKKLLLDMATLKVSNNSSSTVTVPHKTIAAALECIMVGSTKCYSSSTKSVGIPANAIEVINTWNSLQTILNPLQSSTHSHVELNQNIQEDSSSNADRVSIIRPDLVGPLMLPSIGLAALCLGRGDLILTLLLRSSACVNSNSAPVSDSELLIQLDDKNNSPSHYMFKILSSQTRLYEKPAMLGLALSWFIFDNKINFAQELWYNTCLEMTAFAENGNHVERYDRRHEALQLICCSVNNMDVSVNTRMAVGEFLKKIIVDYHECISLHAQEVSSDTNTNTTNTTTTDNNNNNNGYNIQLPLQITEDLGEELIKLFGVMRDNQAASATFVICESQNTVISPNSFSILSRLLLRDGEYNLVFQLLEMYLNAFDRQSVVDVDSDRNIKLTTGKAMPSVLLSYTKLKQLIDRDRQQKAQKRKKTSNNEEIDFEHHQHSTDRLNSNVFTPALIALVGLQQIDMVLKLLNEEIPKYCKYPNAAHVITTMIGLNKAGRFSDAVQLFFENFTHTVSTSTSTSEEKEHNTSTNHHINHDKSRKRHILDIDEGSIHVALTCCANGKLGNEALQILSIFEKSSKNNIPIRLKASDELRLIGLVVKSLATPQNIKSLPDLLSIVVSQGAAQSKPKILTHELFAICFAATVHANNISVATIIADRFKRQGLTVSNKLEDEIINHVNNFLTVSQINSSAIIDSAIGVDTDIDENIEIHPTVTDSNTVTDEHKFHNIGNNNGSREDETEKRSKITTHEVVKTFLSQAFK